MIFDKKQRKKQAKRVMFELSLLLPSFSYMSFNLKNIKDININDRDVVLTKKIIERLGLVLFPYKDKHLKAVSKNNFILKKIDTQDINTFLFGVSLMAEHLECEDNIIKVGMQDELIELQDIILGFLDDAVIKKTFDTASDFKIFLAKDLREYVLK